MEINIKTQDMGANIGSSPLEAPVSNSPPEEVPRLSSPVEVDPLQSRGVYISTYGCQMNVNDTERMYSLLEMSNYVPVSSPDQAQLILINSCSVREKPVHKVHSEVGRYKKLKEKNPHLKIGVGGCVGQQEKGRLLKDIPMVDFVFGTDAIDSLPQLVGQVYQSDQKMVSARFDYQSPYQVETLVRNPGVSTFVNIIKGCDNFCTFCVVPFTRGRQRNRALCEIVEDIQKLTERGVREVTLLGQNVNSYASPCGAHFADLLEAVALETDIRRIRYTTSHPKDFDRHLALTMQKHREKICDFVHLPVQSGHSEVLERMNRGYTREEYIEKAHMILEEIPGVSLSTDIIVGFPGETEEQFQETMSLLEAVPYESIYAFKYSPRPFTKASRYKEQITEGEKASRLKRLQDCHRSIAFELCRRYEGVTLEILAEEFEEGRIRGRSTQNKVVHASGGCEDMVGELVKVEVVEAFPQTLRARVVL